MPELPEIEHLRRTLAKRIVGATVDSVDVRRADVVRTPRGRGGRQAVDALSALRRARVTSTARHGKQLAVVTSRGVVVVHLGMSGRLLSIDEDAPTCAALAAERHVHVTMTMVDDDARRSLLIHSDPRRFGGLWVHASLEEARAQRWSKLGPDALTIGHDRFIDVLGRRRRALKALLLDQSILAGVGNIYADEALHRAGLHPGSRAATIPRQRLEALHTALRHVLRDAVDAGGSTIRDYQDATGRFGTYALLHRVYGRGGSPCLACGTTLRASIVGGRTTVHCPRCQRSATPR